MKSLHFPNVSLIDLPNIAKSITNFAQGHSLWCFDGEMGTGKTTLIQAICKYLQVTTEVTSPTFSLVNEYTTLTENPIYHFDFYRIKNIEEVYDIGYEEYFYSNQICLIEWPTLIKQLLKNEELVYINLTKNADETRNIKATVGRFPL